MVTNVSGIVTVVELIMTGLGDRYVVSVVVTFGRETAVGFIVAAVKLGTGQDDRFGGFAVADTGSLLARDD